MFRGSSAHRAGLIAACVSVLAVSCGLGPQEARVDDLSEYEPRTVAGSSFVGEGEYGALISRDEESSDAEENLELGAPLPDDFPVPDDYRVKAAGSVNGETSAVLEVPSGAEAYAYYREALVEEEMLVVDGGRNDSSYFHAELALSARGFEGNLEFHGDLVEIDIDRYE